ncbi:hypothetical protein evm_007986 [Chilo suppressalis]|nr:hypothetical protein evm_007986 [Chilo suppressalis]
MSDCISDCFEISNHKNDRNVAPIINKCIKRIAQIEGFQDYKVEVQDISTNGGNYLAILQTIDIKGKTETATKEISIFVKNKFQSVQDNILPLDEFYEREVFYYNELSTIYDELQDEVNIPVDERLRKAKSYNESNSEAIILENLSKKGYTTPNRLEPISLQFAEMSIKQLAKFHALSFVLKCKRPEYYEMKVKPFIYPVKVNKEWEDYVVTACATAANCLDSDLKVRLENFKENIVQVYKNFVSYPADKSTCLCHGDFRANNILMKEEEGDIKDLIVVDYQTMRYGSPVTDFIYFVFTGSDQKFRRAYLDELKELYYETLERFMGEFGVEVHDVYPKKRFEQEYRDSLVIGLTIFLIGAPFMLCSDDDVPDLQKDTVSKINLNFDNAIDMCCPAQSGWQELDASSSRSICVLCIWGGLCPAVDYDRLLMMMMMMCCPRLFIKLLKENNSVPINVPTAGAQAFPMDGLGRLGTDSPRGPSVGWWVLTTADAAGTNG